MAEPDFEQLEKLSREVDELVAAGKWNKKEFRRLHGQAVEAVGKANLKDYPGLLEFLYLRSDPSWA